MLSALRRWWKGEEQKELLEKPRSTRPRIVVFDSLFLKDCYSFLTLEREDESLVYATGILAKGVAIPQKLIPIKLAERSDTHAKADPASSHQALLALDATGHALLAVCHTHPWYGPGAVFASSMAFGTFASSGWGLGLV
mgnify:CR=1 FL=1